MSSLPRLGPPHSIKKSIPSAAAEPQDFQNAISMPRKTDYARGESVLRANHANAVLCIHLCSRKMMMIIVVTKKEIFPRKGFRGRAMQIAASVSDRFDCARRFAFNGLPFSSQSTG